MPLIVDTTEAITPEYAYELLLKNKANRPINWRKVEEYAQFMRDGHWVLHAQGIILDGDGNILTGQKRLWAVVYSGETVYMRISRGNPVSSARWIDRGDPQSARDLASRGTGKKHSPIEASIARAILVLGGNPRPSVDILAGCIEQRSAQTAALMAKTVGTRKSRAVLMILAAICVEVGPQDVERSLVLARRTEELATNLEAELFPHTAEKCWGRGAAFGLALERARKLVQVASR